MINIPTSEPAEIIAGTSVKWTKYIADYLPADGWTYSIVLVNADGKCTVTGSDNGDGTHLAEIDPTDSADWSAGEYEWQSYVTDGTAIYLVAVGTMTVVTNYADQSSNYDARSVAKKNLDAINTALINRNDPTIATYSLAGRSLSRFTSTELLEERKVWRAEYNREQRKKDIANGNGNAGRLRARFVK